MLCAERKFCSPCMQLLQYVLRYAACICLGQACGHDGDMTSILNLHPDMAVHRMPQGLLYSSRWKGTSQSIEHSLNPVMPTWRPQSPSYLQLHRTQEAAAAAAAQTVFLADRVLYGSKRSLSDNHVSNFVVLKQNRAYFTTCWCTVSPLRFSKLWGWQAYSLVMRSQYYQACSWLEASDVVSSILSVCLQLCQLHGKACCDIEERLLTFLWNMPTCSAKRPLPLSSSVCLMTTLPAFSPTKICKGKVMLTQACRQLFQSRLYIQES